MHAAVFRHDGSPNLGDALQTIALSRWFASVEAVSRYYSKPRANRGTTLVANGWLGRNIVDITDTNALFAGVHVHENEDNYRWIQNSRFAVGARDPFTQAELGRRGINSEFIGCCTLTFDSHRGPRTGVLAVDADHSGAVRLTHLNPMAYDRQWEAASRLLERYRTAEAVYTTRLHVALPCLAFGTPVALAHPRKVKGDAAKRFGLWEALGLPYEKLAVMDVQPWRERFRDFLQRALGPLSLSEPKFPE